MTRINVPFVVNGQFIEQWPKTKIAAGGQNYFYAVFNTHDNDPWGKIDEIKASFRCDGMENPIIMSVVKSSGNSLECLIPWEVMAKIGYFDTGIFGGDRLPTTMARTFVTEGCICDGDEPRTPTPDWFNKIENDIDELKNSSGNGSGNSGSGNGGNGNATDSFSPIATVTQTNDGAVISITDKDGTTTATITNGKDGQPGKDGKDGQDGKDYVLTEADKQEIAEMVDVSSEDVDLTGYATEQYVDDAIENSKEIYVGEGEPPENVVFQIDPEGDVVVFDPVEATEEMTQPVGLDVNGKLWTTPSGGSGEYRLVDTFDLSSGALSYTADTTGCKDILVVNESAVTCSGTGATWKGVTLNAITKSVGTVANYVALPDNMILAIVTRDTTEPLANHRVYFNAVETNNEFTIICTTASAGIIKVYGR